MTPWEAYRFKRNVMGLISAGDEHNRRGDEALKGIESVVKVVEDVLIFDNDFDAHVERVRQAPVRCNKAGITLHPPKFVFVEPEVDYYGFKVGEFGYTISDRLVRALTDFPVPVNKTDLRSFCGLAQQFEPFTPELIELFEPWRPLTCSNVTFVWEEPQQQAFERTMKTLSDPRMLANFDGSSPLCLETDAAQLKSLGMALWRQSSTDEWKLLQCASRHITDTEARYSATEVKLLAVVWAAKIAHLFLAGGDVELIADHRPLTSISIINSKTLDELSTPRIVRLKENWIDLIPPECHMETWHWA